VRQLANENGAVTLTKAYDPYSVNNLNSGASGTSYGFAAEMSDPTGLLYLRAALQPKRGQVHDPRYLEWNDQQPLSFNRWRRYNSAPGKMPSQICLLRS
jgi:hypothetical protein